MFKVRFKKSVQKDLRAFSKADQRRVLDAIQRVLAKDPHQGKALTGEFKGLYRWRTGKFRIIYDIQKDLLVVLVLRIGHRKDAYR